MVWLLLAAFVMSVTPAPAQQAKEGPNVEERAAALDTEIRASIKDAEEFRARAEAAEDTFARILLRRSEDAGLVAIERTHDLAQLVIDREAGGRDPGPWRARATELLEGMQIGIQSYLGSPIPEGSGGGTGRTRHGKTGGARGSPGGTLGTRSEAS